MSSRPILAPFQVITNGDMSTTVTSAVTVIQTNSMVSYEVNFTGAPVGVINVQVSNSYSKNVDGTVRNAGSWTTLTLSTPSTVSGAGTNFIDIDALGAYAVRLVYVPTSGSGVINAFVAGKSA